MPASTGATSTSKQSCKASQKKDDGFIPGKSSPDFPFVEQFRIREPGNVPIYGLAFNHYLPSGANFQFATCSLQTINIYSYNEARDQFDLDKSLVDTNVSENYFDLEWCYDDLANKAVIIAGGVCGHIKVFDPQRGIIERELYGHGEAINELRVNPSNSAIFASCSKDNSARIWHLRQKRCLVIFAGLKGHVDQVLSCDWSPCCDFLVTGSMDHTIRRWKIDNAVRKCLQEACKDARNAYKQLSKGSDSSDEEDFKCKAPHVVQFPVNESTDIHVNYVDCVRYLGDFVISKGSEGSAFIFRFGHGNEKLTETFHNTTDRVSTVLAEIALDECRTWFARFDISPTNDYLILSGLHGEVFAYELANVGKSECKTKFVPKVPTANESKAHEFFARHIGFDPDGETFIVTNDRSEVMLFRRKSSS